MLKQMMYFVSR